MRVKGAFAKLCAAMNQQLVPVLNSAGFSSSDTPFRREEVQARVRRCQSEGTEVVAVLFNRRCEALFSGQLYIEPREGVRHSTRAEHSVAALCAARTWWPRGVIPFRAAPTLFDRLRGHRGIDVARPIQQCAALLPHAEHWFRDRTRTRFVVDGRLAVRRPA